MNSRKPTLIEAHHAEHARDHLVGQVAAEQRDRDASSRASINTHSSSEPSCEPQVAARR